ncbi:MAG: PAS domain S-box protein, partial [bacterium]
MVDTPGNKDLVELAAVLERIPVPILVLDQSGEITHVNRHFENCYSYVSHELVNTPFWLLIPDRDRDRSMQFVRRFLEQPDNRPIDSELEIMIRRKRGGKIPVKISLGQINLDGPTQVIATLWDKTEVRQSLGEQENTDPNRRYLVEYDGAFWRIGFDNPIPLDLPEIEQVERALSEGYFFDTNINFAKQYGYSEEDAMEGVRFEDTMPRDDPNSVPMLLEVVRGRFKGEKVVSFERDRHNNEKVFENSFIPNIVNGEVESVWGTSRDITEQNRIKTENVTMKSALDTMIQGVILIDATTDGLPIIYTNKRFLEITGYSYDEVHRQNFRYLLGRDTDSQFLSEMHRSMRHRTPFEGEVLNYRKDGTPFWNHLQILPIVDRVGAVTTFMVSILDLTEDRKVPDETNSLKRALAHASRVATLGELTAAIAHEINQPLTAIAANVSAARRFLLV